jgi:transcriptional regulator with XRE-family HTH domain
LSRLLKSSIKYEDTTQRGTRTKGLKTREVAQLVGIDQALISKFESGIEDHQRTGREISNTS